MTTAVDLPRASQEDAELAWLLEAAAVWDPRSILEIGVARGGLTSRLCRAFPEAAVAAIDPALPAWHPDLGMVRWLPGSSSDPAVIERASAWAPFDLVFIDGDHSYEAVRSDWETYWPLTRTALCFHDIVDGPETAGVPRLWREIKARPFIVREIVADWKQGWAGIGVVLRGPAL